ncbi:MAG: hypothetical protein AAB963_02485 [Patescibacteria group bacterium]
MATEFIITEGPGKMDLMLALFDDKPGGRRRTVVFCMGGGTVLPFPLNGLSLHVISVERVQGREYWEIVGNDVERKTGNRVTLWYSTKTRKGTGKIEMPVRDEDGGTVGYE